ncbi:glycogenin-2 isoform X3 [Cheilinus undulatus]|uniref:glycogenin-2 isoform X3 n=1 Tax=Cheilinus undulatus TaxID=241271 RepID=UPI001BD4509D|nr:glycogenin-2 isoform X3 [Cheilinus undulatus]
MTPTMLGGEAFITLATTESYCKGAAVVARSLRRHGTTRSIVLMVTPNVSEQSRLSLRDVFDEVVLVDLMDSEDQSHLALLGRPDLGITFTKIHCWTLTQYSKCVFLDADTLVLSNVDDLFERDELSAAPDPGWPDCFNSGVFVFRPSLQTHAALLEHALQHGSFDGDQGLLNSFFSGWVNEDISKHLPFIYNLSASSIYSYRPAFQQFGHNAKIVHFIGAVKPWSTSSRQQEGSTDTMAQFLSLWWKEYNGYTRTTLPEKKEAKKPKRIQKAKTKAKVVVRETLDSTKSLLAHFSAPSLRLQIPAKPEKQESQTENEKPLDVEEEEESKIPETTEIEESPVEEEELEGSDEASDIETYTTEEVTEEEQLEHRKQWEIGQADYLGRDAFQNIQRMLDRFLD